MTTTLRETYKARKLQRLHERVNLIDAQILEENRAAWLIVEAMDEEELDKAESVIEKLTNLSAKLPNARALKNAVDAAVKDVNKYTGSGGLKKNWLKLKAKFSGGENPLVKALALASAIETGFKLLPKIIKNLKLDQASGDTTFKELLLSDQAAGTPEASEKTNDAVGMLIKAFTPSGVFGAFKKLPYGDSNALAQDIMNTPISALTQAKQTVDSGPKAADVAPELKDDLKKGANVSGSSNVEPTKGGETPGGTKSSEPSKSATTPAVKGDEKTAQTGKTSSNRIDQILKSAGVGKIDSEQRDIVVKLLRHLVTTKALDTSKLKQKR